MLLLWRPLGRRRSAGRLAPRYRPRVEPLEERRLLSFDVGPSVNIGKLPGNQNEAALVINPTDPNNLVAFSNEEAATSGVRAYVSNDGGATWTSRVIGAGDALGSAACCDTQAAFDQFGNLFVTYLDATPDIVVKVLLSTDGGDTFRLLTTLGDGDQPSVATGAGSVWLTYQSEAGNIVAHGAAVTGLGAVGAFRAAQVAPGSGGGNFGNIAVGPAGQVLVTYQSPTAGQGPSTIFVNHDPDGLGPLGFGGAVPVAVTNVGGFDSIPAEPRVKVDAEANVYYDRSPGPFRGRAYLVYLEETQNGNNDTNVLVRFSDNNGASWSAPARVNDDAGTNSQFLPEAAVDPATGNLAVAWYDARNSANNTTAQIFASVSFDGGRTFQPNVLVSAGTSNASLAGTRRDFGDYNTMDFLNGIFYPIWADNSPELPDNPDRPRLDIATARVFFNAATPQQQAFLNQAYLDLLGRNIDPQGLAFNGNLLARGVSRGQIVAGLTGSTEYRARVVQGLYMDLLNRPADPGGLNGAVGFLAAGGTVEQLAAILAGSAEYFAVQGGTIDGFINGLYQDAVGRPADPGGLAFYRSLLAQGFNRTQVATFFFTSGEYYSRLVQGFYQRFLRRPADPGGLNFLVSNLQRGATDEWAINFLVSSDEYFARLQGT